MSMYENAIDALICGVEDYQQGTGARYKSALRNVYAGMLLILKEKLRSMAPEMGDLMISKIAIPEMEGDKVVWRAKGRKTVDTHTLRERFKSLGIRFDWNQFDEISDVRNEIEHKYTELNGDAVRALIAKAFVLLSKFLTDELRLELKDELTDEAYKVFVDIKQIYDTEKARCAGTWVGFKTESAVINSLDNELYCPACASDLVMLKADGRLECKFCNETFDHEEVVEAITRDHFAVENYISVKDGGHPGSVTCPMCDRASLVVEEMLCACCGETFYGDCQVCGATIPASEFDGSGICSWCQCQVDKND